MIDEHEKKFKFDGWEAKINFEFVTKAWKILEAFKCF